MAVLSAFHIAGGIQINEVGEAPGTIECRMVFPEDAEWAAAVQWVALPLIQRTYYDDLGQVVRAMQSPDLRYFDHAPAGRASIGGFYPHDEFYIENGAPVAIPENPTPGFTFNFATKQWADMRTLADWMQDLQTSRAKAVMSRIEFVLAAVRFGLLSEADAEIAIAGNLPATFQGIIDSLPAADRFEALIRWKGAVEVDRLNPLIVTLANALGVSEWNLDQLFEVEWPAPLPDWEEGRLHI